jgi:hypothetical protein
MMPLRRRALLCAAAFASVAQAAAARTALVADVSHLAAAIAQAGPGDTILLADGVYPIARKIASTASGTRQAPIVVRAAHRYGARIRSTGLIAFEITGSWWTFADLDVRGVCVDDTVCEHAFHVVGHADGFHLTGSRLVDFNAQLKVNADTAHALPANGLVEGNEFFDSHPRHTGNPVAPVNIDNAVGWIVRGNSIHDFQKDGPGEDSYGAFVKGGSINALMDHNEISCARDRPATGHSVGLSFGAHGMDPALCPPYWNAARPCNPEVTDGTMRNNVITSCNGDGIYVNQGRNSHIMFNALVNTGGMTFRFAGSSGEASGNLLGAPVRIIDGAKMALGKNPVVPAGAPLACVDRAGHTAWCGTSPPVRECLAAGLFGRCVEDPACFDDRHEQVACVWPVERLRKHG